MSDKSTTTTSGPDATTQDKQTGLWNTATQLAGGGAPDPNAAMTTLQQAITAANGDPSKIAQAVGAYQQQLTNPVNATPTAAQIQATTPNYTGELVAPTTTDSNAAYQDVRDLQGAGTPQFNSATNAATNASLFTPQNITAAQTATSLAPAAAQTGLISAPTTSQVQAGTIGQTQQANGGDGSVGTSAVTSNGVTAGMLPDVDLSQYLNPGTQDVVNTSLADIDRARQAALTTTDAQALASKAFGGSRSGVAEGITNTGFANTAASTAANLESQNYTNAVAAAQADLNRKLSADTTTAGNALTASQANASNTLQGGIAGLNNMTTASVANANNAADIAKANQSTGLSASTSNAANTLAGNTTAANDNANIGMFNTGQTNTVNSANADRNNQVGMFNTGQANTVAQNNVANSVAGQNVNLAGANTLNSIGNSVVNTGLQKANALDTTGAQQQQQQQNVDNSAYQQWLQKQQYPLQMLQYLQGLQGTPGTTSTTTTAGGLPQQILGAISSGIPGLGGLFSGQPIPPETTTNSGNVNS